MWSMRIAGIQVDERNVLDLAQVLRRADEPGIAHTIEEALIAGAASVDLDHEQRIAVLRALEDGPDPLAPLRGELLKQHDEGRGFADVSPRDQLRPAT